MIYAANYEEITKDEKELIHYIYGNFSHVIRHESLTPKQFINEIKKSYDINNEKIAWVVDRIANLKSVKLWSVK